MGNSYQRHRKALWILGLASVTLLLWVCAERETLGVALPPFTEHQDIGTTPQKGDMHYNPRTREYSITGGGANIWSKEDAFQFVYTQLSGDLTITADVSFLGKGAEAHRKAALMIRQSLDPDSAYADVALHGDGLTSLQYRLSAGADTQEIRSDLKAPARIRIERHGNEFTIAAGSTNDTLAPAGSITVEMRDPIYAGLAVCSHNANVLETALFRNVALELGSKQ